MGETRTCPQVDPNSKMGLDFSYCYKMLKGQDLQNDLPLNIRGIMALQPFLFRQEASEVQFGNVDHHT